MENWVIDIIGQIEHWVSKLDTLAGVAIKYGVEVADIKKMNGLATNLQMFARKSRHIPLPGKHPPSPSLASGAENMEMFSEKFRKLWSLWEIRTLVTVSLLLQIILILLGSRRKIANPHSRIGILLNVTVWCAYIGADSVATVALSVMEGSGANCRYDSSIASNRVHAFWAPLLLLHLGGPDTITAFSMQDNDLWLRHLLTLIVEVGVAFHLFLRFWSSSAISFLAIPVFITGIVKYGERTWVLWSSSTQFNHSEGSFPVGCSELVLRKSDINPKDYNLVEAYYLYRALRYLFMDYPISERDKEYNYFMIRKKSAEDAFRVVATEVGLLYDVLYTKADIIYSRLGIFRRCISFICSISALVLFPVIIDVRSYLLIDIAVTYLLLAGAVVVEIYAFIIILSSDWTKLWLISLRMARDNQISRALVDNFQRFTNCLRSCFTTRKRWSESIGQYNLTSSVHKKRKYTYLGLEKLSCTSKLLGRYQYLSWENVDISLQETVFSYLKGIADELQQATSNNFDFRRIRDQYLSRRGEYALRDYTFDEFLVFEDYEGRVIMWHFVTDKYYYRDANKLSQDCKIGKWLSDYMVYLLLFRPSIFPKGIGQLRYEHTYNHVIGFSSFKNPYSVLESAEEIVTRFAHGEKDCNKRWKVIIEVWMELLTYAASHFDWKEHIQYLRRGGELLTLVSILMIHFRLSKQLA